MMFCVILSLSGALGGLCSMIPLFSGPQVIKRFFMFNFAEHGHCPANKSQITNNCKFFLAKYS